MSIVRPGHKRSHSEPSLDLLCGETAEEAGISAETPDPRKRVRVIGAAEDDGKELSRPSSRGSAVVVGMKWHVAAPVVEGAPPDKRDEEAFRRPFVLPVGEYTAGDGIGAGGFGCVCRGVRNVVWPDGSVEETPVAIKRIDNVLCHVIMARMALRELRFLRMFGDGNRGVVKYVDAFWHTREPLPSETAAAAGCEEERGDGSGGAQHPCVDLYIVTELFTGDLRVTELGNTRRNEHVACFVMLQVLLALENMHAIGVVHRDLTYKNVLVEDATPGTMKRTRAALADFGHARSITTDRVADPMYSGVTTLWYRCPEMLMGATEVDGKADVWAAGCVLAELLRGGNPLMCGMDELDQLGMALEVNGTTAARVLPFARTPKCIRMLSELAKRTRPRGAASGEGAGSAGGGGAPPRRDPPVKKFLPSDVSALAVDLVQRMLSLRVSARFTAQQAIDHPFFAKMRARFRVGESRFKTPSSCDASAATAVATGGGNQSEFKKRMDKIRLEEQAWQKSLAKASIDDMFKLMASMIRRVKSLELLKALPPRAQSTD